MSESARLEGKRSLQERLRQHPKLLARFEQMLDLIEGGEQEITKAAEAEQFVGEQLQQLGQETLQAWAEDRHDRQAAYWERRDGINRKEKKSSTGTRAMGE
ncbi:MAG: hypothetical protein ACKVZH_16100 [Blastocatellia bacterium]